MCVWEKEGLAYILSCNYGNLRRFVDFLFFLLLLFLFVFVWIGSECTYVISCMFLGINMDPRVHHWLSFSMALYINF